MAHLQRDQWSFEKFNELGLQEFQALIVNYGNGNVLLKREDSRWILPAYAGDQENYESSFLPQFVIQKIRKEVDLPLELCVLRQVWRKEMTIVRNKEQSTAEKAVVLLSCSNCQKESIHESHIQKGYKWWRADRADIYHLFPEARSFIVQEMAWVKLREVPWNRLKWQRPGWMEAKSAWIQNVLLRNENARLTKPLATERSTPLGTVIEAQTAIGKFFLKCTPPWQNDAAYTNILSSIAPQYVASPVAIDIEEETMLTRDYGSILVPALFDDEKTIELTRDFVKFQRIATERIEEVVRAGMPDCRENGLKKRMDWASTRPLLDTIAKRAKHTEAVQFFRENLEHLKQEVKTLYASGVPSTVTHNDLYMSNVYKSQDDDRYMFFDWVEGYVSHPMAGVLDGLSFEEYIKEWEIFLRRGDLSTVFESAQKVRLIISLVLTITEAEITEEPEATDSVERVADKIQSVFHCYRDSNDPEAEFIRTYTKANARSNELEQSRGDFQTS